MEKTLDNTDIAEAQAKVSDIKVFGNGNLFRLISKASSAKEGWMKSTKAMQMPTGVLVQVTTQQNELVAEALEFVPGIRLHGEGEHITFVPIRADDTVMLG